MKQEILTQLKDIEKQIIESAILKELKLTKDKLRLCQTDVKYMGNDGICLDLDKWQPLQVREDLRTYGVYLD